MPVLALCLLVMLQLDANAAALL